MPTQFKRVSNSSSLYTGHHIPLIGRWNKENGYTKFQSLVDQTVGESLACPIIAVVTSKFGNKDVSLTITATLSKLKSVQERTRGSYTIKKTIYEPDTNTITTEFTIPRYTRPGATFLLTGLGKLPFEIASITDDVSFDVGGVEFYALASNGSKVIYWLGIHMLAEELKEIVRPWVAPTTCSRCSGTGIEPDTSITDCQQCLGYGYDGYSSTKYVQRKLGIDVGLAREVMDWDNLTDDDHDIIKKYINKAWTQKWWVTPTVKEIRRLIRHFYMITDAEFDIVERFHNQEPVWKLFLPLEPNTNAPFGQNTADDRFLLKYIAETITPAGVSVFVGFFKWMADFEFNFDDIDDSGPMFPPLIDTSIDGQYSLWGTPRWAFWNGWQDAIIDFEDEIVGSIVCSGAYECSGAYRQNANDKFRHVCRLDGNSAYFQVDNGTGITTGCVELWTRPINSNMRFSLVDGHNIEGVYIDYDVSQKTFSSGSNILDLMYPDNPKHLRMCWEQTGDHVKDWVFATDYRRKIVVDDNGVRRNNILYEINMSSWAQFTSRSNNTNYVRVTQMIGGVETEINSQTYDDSWNGGNQDSVAILLTTTAQETELYVYYGDIDLGSPGYTSNLIVTANNPAVNDYKIVQDDYYRIELDYSEGGNITNVWTRVSGGDVQIGKVNDARIVGSRIDVGGTPYFLVEEETPTITLIEGAVGANAGAVLVAFSVTGAYEDIAHAALPDVTYEVIYIFCDCQLIKITARMIFADTVNNVTAARFFHCQFVNAYFSHQGYKYNITHTVEVVQDRVLSPNFLTKLYSCYFDITSNDGFVMHYISETTQHIEASLWKLDERATEEAIQLLHDNSGDNDIYTANTDESIVWVQIDDFTEADGNNDTDGDQPAHRKNTELLSALTETEESIESNESEFDYDISINLDPKLSGTFRTNPGIRYFRFYNRTPGTGFIDAIGWIHGSLSGASGTYTLGDNWQTLHPEGWGINNDDFIDGEVDILERYFNNDKPIKL